MDQLTISIILLIVMIIISTGIVFAITKSKLLAIFVFIGFLGLGIIMFSQLQKKEQVSSPLESKCAAIEMSVPILFSALEETATIRSGKPTKCTDLQSQDELDDILSSVEFGKAIHEAYSEQGDGIEDIK
jgi:hypothetical protein